MSQEPMDRVRPTVSIVLPTLQERAHIRDCLDSLLAQDDERVTEILVGDGGSTDGTRDIVEAFGPPVRLVENPKVSAAGALNACLEQASGDVIVRADAHATYAPDYVRRCVDLLVESGADNVGGPMVPVGANALGRAVAAVTTSPLGVGPGVFHYARERSEVDTVFLGCWWRETLVEIDGWDDEHLQWAAEDHELNFRLRRQGGRILVDPAIESRYFPRDTWRSLARQYANYGTGKVSTLAKHRALPTWRPLAPATLVAGSAGAVVAGVVARRPGMALAPFVVYGAGALVAGLSVSKEPGVAAPRAVGVLAVCHWSYGYGFWRGVARVLLRQGFDARPRRGRR